MSGDFKGGLEILSGGKSTITGKGTKHLLIDAINVKGMYRYKEQGYSSYSIKLTTTVNNLDDLIQLQTTESDNTRVNDLKCYFNYKS